MTDQIILNCSRKQIYSSIFSFFTETDGHKFDTAMPLFTVLTDTVSCYVD